MTIQSGWHPLFLMKLNPLKEIHLSHVLQVVVVDPLDSKDLAHLTLLDRTELGITFTKVLTILLWANTSTHLAQRLT